MSGMTVEAGQEGVHVEMSIERYDVTIFTKHAIEKSRSLPATPKCLQRLT